MTQILSPKGSTVIDGYSQKAGPYPDSSDLVVSIVEYFFRSQFSKNESKDFLRNLATLSEKTRSSFLFFELKHLQEDRVRLSEVLGKKRLLPTSVYELAYLHEVTLNKRARKKNGVFYTPRPIAERILRNCLRLTEKRRPLVLDPSCGAGIFLLQAFTQLFEREERSDYDCAARIISEQIFGVDLDPLSVELTSLFLALHCLQHVTGPVPATVDFSPNLQCGNFLIDQAHTATESNEEIEKLGPLPSEFFDSTCFDIIAGNPPYGISRGGGLDPEENKLLRKIYADSISGKVNKYLLFVARSFSLLSPGGCLSFIIPNAWMGIKDGAAIRKLLLREKALREITVFKKPVFENAGVETVIFTAKRDGNFDNILINQTTSVSDNYDAQISLPVSHCMKNLEARIPAYWHEGAETLLAKIYSQSFMLESNGSPFKPMIALQAYSVGKGEPPQTLETRKTKAFHSHVESPGFFPYLEGKDVDSYKLRWSGGYLRHGPFLAEPQKIERFSGPRVILREILKPPPYLLAAAFSERLFLYNKSVLHIIFNDNHHHLPEWKRKSLMMALTVLLNSKLASVLVLLNGIKSQRSLFPKVLRQDLACFPLPLSFLENHVELTALAEQLVQEIERNSKRVEGEAHDTRINTLRSEADAAVENLYGLTTPNSAMINRILCERRNNYA